MKIILFLSHYCVINSEQWSFRVFYSFTKWDWLCSSIKFRFYNLTCLKINVELLYFYDFFYVFFRFRSIVFHLSIVVSIITKSLFYIIFFSLTITMRWSWNDRRRKRKSYWKEKKKRRLNYVVSCVYLWIERE